MQEEAVEAHRVEPPLCKPMELYFLHQLNVLELWTLEPTCAIVTSKAISLNSWAVPEKET